MRAVFACSMLIAAMCSLGQNAYGHQLPATVSYVDIALHAASFEASVTQSVVGAQRQSGMDGGGRARLAKWEFGPQCLYRDALVHCPLDVVWDLTVPIGQVMWLKIGDRAKLYSDGHHLIKPMQMQSQKLISTDHQSHWLSWRNVLDGMRHFFYGLDHILLICILVLFVWQQRAPDEAVGMAVRSVLHIVTAFVAGHWGGTLVSIVWGGQGWIEPLIALSIVLFGAKIAKHTPTDDRGSHPTKVLAFSRKIWAGTALVGIVHGMGFAGPGGLGSFGAMLWVAVQANVGIEIASLMLAMVVLALLVLLHKYLAPRLVQTTIHAAVAVVAIVAAAWFWQRLWGTMIGHFSGIR